MKILVWVVAVILLVSRCQGDDDPKKSTTNKENLAKTPEPPFGRSPFAAGTDDALKPADLKNKVPPIAAPPASCGTKVTAFDVFMDGAVRGGLKYNARPRTGVKV